MLAEIFRFLSPQKLSFLPFANEWIEVNLSPCDNGMRVLKQSFAWKALSTQAFHKLISNISFNEDKPLAWSSMLSILFKVIESGSVEQLLILRSLPIYDQIPLNLQDHISKKTTLNLASSSGNRLMLAQVRQILMEQRLELENKHSIYGQEITKTSLNNHLSKEVTFNDSIEEITYEVDGPLRSYKYR